MLEVGTRFCCGMSLGVTADLLMRQLRVFANKEVGVRWKLPAVKHIGKLVGGLLTLTPLLAYISAKQKGAHKDGTNEGCQEDCAVAKRRLSQSSFGDCEDTSTAMKGSSEDSIESIRPSNLQAFANMSTLHGMSHIFAYGHMTFRRFLWSLSFLGSLALLMIVCMDRIIYYLEYPQSQS
ncbi:hypothetical protein WMY93_001232 [Mugilogobius chulae]|uniref:Uncharacterized protein n=1 Tax=Mugilogobius chulae TaxID=88201 RepID=A0AAW0Q1P8_9GOBI